MEQCQACGPCVLRTNQVDALENATSSELHRIAQTDDAGGTTTATTATTATVAAAATSTAAAAAASTTYASVSTAAAAAITATLRVPGLGDALDDLFDRLQGASVRCEYVRICHICRTGRGWTDLSANGTSPRFELLDAYHARIPSREMPGGQIENNTRFGRGWGGVA